MDQIDPSPNHILELWTNNFKKQLKKALISRLDPSTMTAKLPWCLIAACTNNVSMPYSDKMFEFIQALYKKDGWDVSLIYAKADGEFFFSKLFQIHLI
jgi:hypothetical protein